MKRVISGDFKKSFQFEGLVRFYNYHVPSGCTNPIPVVLVFHGGSGNPDAVKDDTKMNAVADKNKFIVVYPQGTKRVITDNGFYWNDGRLFPDGTPSDVNDVGFIAQVLNKLAESYQINRKKIYACGISNGSLFCNRLAKKLPSIAAIACVAGHRGPNEIQPAPPRHIPLIQFSGVLDRYVPYLGGEPIIETHWVTVFQSVPNVISQWIVFNQCRFVETVQIGQAIKHDYGDVVLWVLQDGGHTWPGGNDYPLLGFTNRDINASELIWQFFKNKGV